MNHTKRILVVESDSQCLHRYSKALLGEGFEVLEASTAARGLELARRELPGIILLEEALPDCSGVELCRSMKTDPAMPGVFVAVISDQAGAGGHKSEALAAGADDYLLKPLAASELLVRVRTLARLRNATMALRESEERYRQVTESIREVFWMTDVEKSQMLYISPAYAQIWGRSCASLYASPRDWVEAIHPEDRERVLQAAVTRQVSGEYDELYRIVRLDGSVRWIQDRAFPVRDESGRVYRVAGIAEDVTSRKQAEEVLRESQARARAAEAELAMLAHAVESTSEPICMTDLQDRFVFVNRAFERTYGYTAVEVLGKTPDLLRSPKTPPAHLARIQQRTRAGGWQGEVFNRRKDGTEFPILLTTSQIKDAQGRVLGLMGVAQDITERRRAEERIRLLADAVHSTRELICISDTQNRFTFVNEAALKAYGYTPEELLGREPGMLYSSNNPAGLCEHVFQETLGGGWHGEVISRRKDGTEFPISLSTSQIKDSEGKTVGLLGVGRDISEEKRREQQSGLFSQLRHRLGAALNPEQAAELILDTAADLFRWDAAYLVLYSPAEDRIIPVLAFDAVAGRRTGMGPRSRPLPPTPVMRLVLEQGGRLLNHPTGSSLGLNHPVFGDSNPATRSRMFAPINAQDGVLGILSVQSETANAYSQEHLRLLQALADDCGGALQRMKVAAALLAAEAKYRGIFENATEGIFQTSPDGRLLGANPALANIFGYASPDEMLAEVGDVGRQMYVRPEQRLELHGLLTTHGSVQDFQAENYRKDGSRVWVSLNAHVVRDEAGKVRHFEGTLQDITERKRLEKELLDTSATERRRIGHELHDGLGQYLAGIAFRAKALEQTLAAEASPHAARARELTTLVSNAMRQTRSVARGFDPVQVETIGLPAALQNLAAEVTQFFNVSCLFRCAGAELQVEPQTGLSLYRLTQEAIHNAIRHGEAQRIDVELTRTGTCLCLRISDNGVGFTVQNRPRTGMGLRVMEYRARSMGAKLQIDSQLKRGTEVRCEVPLSLALVPQPGEAEGWLPRNGKAQPDRAIRIPPD